MMIFFFFKQKTAYEMRISDWSSDVCSSDLEITSMTCLALIASITVDNSSLKVEGEPPCFPLQESLISLFSRSKYCSQVTENSVGIQIGRASCRERVCQYV